MNRRAFLSFLAVGAAVSTVAPHAGFLEKIRSYFFAPRGGWLQTDLLRPGFAIHGGTRGGCKMLTLSELDRLVQEYYGAPIVAHMLSDSVLLREFRDKFDVLDARLVGEIGGVPLVSTPLAPPNQVIVMQGNWRHLERFPFPATLSTPHLRLS